MAHAVLKPAQCDYLATVYAGLFTIFLSSLYHAMDALPNLKPAEIEPYLSILEHVRDSGLLERSDVDVSARITEIKDKVRELCGHLYEEKRERLTAHPGVNAALPFLLMTDEIEKHAKLLDKRFPEPILGSVSGCAASRYAHSQH